VRPAHSLVHIWAPVQRVTPPPSRSRTARVRDLSRGGLAGRSDAQSLAPTGLVILAEGLRTPAEQPGEVVRETLAATLSKEGCIHE